MKSLMNVRIKVILSILWNSVTFVFDLISCSDDCLFLATRVSSLVLKYAFMLW